MLAEAERMLHECYPGGETSRLAMTVGQLAKWGGPTLSMTGLVIGTIWCQVMAGSFAMADISLDREGRPITKPGSYWRWSTEARPTIQS